MLTLLDVSFIMSYSVTKVNLSVANDKKNVKAHNFYKFKKMLVLSKLDETFCFSTYFVTKF